MERTEQDLIEIELLRKAAGGDRAAFSQLYDAYSRILYSAALRILNNPDDALDVTQDSFLQIWDKAALYDPARGRPLTWAMTLVRNRSIDRLRSIQRRMRLRDEVEQESQASLQIDQPDSSDEVEGMERGRILRSAVLQLSPDQREAIELAFFGGLTQNEVAERLNQPLGTVKARIRRGMLRLRELVGRRL
jgi:RNA polymerase sigma-70 factor (ECF subfamily)